MRLFIAIELPEHIKKELGKFKVYCQKSNVWAKWVEEKNLHITLVFLGEVEENYIYKIKEILEDIRNKFKIINTRISGHGFFPNSINPRVFFVEIDKHKEVEEIFKYLYEKLSFLKLKESSSFHSHITLARLKNKRNLDKLKNLLEDYNYSLSFNIEKITLFKSNLTPQGPIYEKLHTVNLAQISS